MKEKFLKAKGKEVDLDAIANEIASKHKVIFCAGDFYQYKNGCYYQCEQLKIEGWIKNILADRYSSRNLNEIIKVLKIVKFVETEKLNNTNLLNLKNGLFEIDTYELSKHNPKVYSTIQLDVKYDKNAKCDKWKKTLDEIFEGDKDKIELFQEFCGLCLTKETKYQKSLFCVGEGDNGKSTLLNVLRSLLGKKNCSSVPLEMFENRHYRARLFAKLANISIELGTRTVMDESKFKAIVSGDEIEADPKYKDPFNFCPFCKLIFAVNEMPRVEDKTYAFYKRLIILRFEKQFKDKEANRDLEEELVKELDGIFLWALEGLKRLRKEGYFSIKKDMEEVIKDYRRDNNNVIAFIEEECDLDPVLSVKKDFLYKEYSKWCNENGFRPLHKNYFGRELIRLKSRFPTIIDDRESKGRYWKGIEKIVLYYPEHGSSKIHQK